MINSKALESQLNTNDTVIELFIECTMIKTKLCVFIIFNIENKFCIVIIKSKKKKTFDCDASHSQYVCCLLYNWALD